MEKLQNKPESAAPPEPPAASARKLGEAPHKLEIVGEKLKGTYFSLSPSILLCFLLLVTQNSRLETLTRVPSSQNSWGVGTRRK